MKRFKRTSLVLAAACVIALALGNLAAPAVAVPPHRHCMLTPNGWVEIGSGVVENAPHEPAFHNLHNHVHASTSVPTTIIPVFDLNAGCP